jgi:ABC-2 type transport system permease protein
MFPIGILILGSVPWRAAGAPEFVVILILGVLAGSAMGLTMGTLVPPNRISIAFSLVLTPLLFTGCSQYPWPTLDSLRWFQIVTLFNPLTYVSEGMRGALTSVPHLGTGWIALGLVGSLVLFGAAGLLGFERRAID